MILLIIISFELFIFISAQYASLFENEEEAAFSNYKLWESIGFIMPNILQQYLCIHGVGTLLTLVLLPFQFVCTYTLFHCVFKKAKSLLKHGWNNSKSVGPLYDNICYEYLSTYHLIMQ